MLNEFNTESKVLICAQKMEISRTLNKLEYHNNVTIVCRSQILLTMINFAAYWKCSFVEIVTEAFQTCAIPYFIKISAANYII